MRKGGTRGSGTVAEPLRPMASKLFNKSLRSPIPITVCRGELQGCCRECSRFFTLLSIS